MNVQSQREAQVIGATIRYQGCFCLVDDARDLNKVLFHQSDRSKTAMITGSYNNSTIVQDLTPAALGQDLTPAALGRSRQVV